MKLTKYYYLNHVIGKEKALDALLKTLSRNLEIEPEFDYEKATCYFTKVRYEVLYYNGHITADCKFKYVTSNDFQKGVVDTHVEQSFLLKDNALFISYKNFRWETYDLNFLNEYGKVNTKYVEPIDVNIEFDNKIFNNIEAKYFENLSSSCSHYLNNHYSVYLSYLSDDIFLTNVHLNENNFTLMNIPFYNLIVQDEHFKYDLLITGDGEEQTQAEIYNYDYKTSSRHNRLGILFLTLTIISSVISSAFIALTGLLWADFFYVGFTKGFPDSYIGNLIAYFLMPIGIILFFVILTWIFNKLKKRYRYHTLSRLEENKLANFIAEIRKEALKNYTVMPMESSLLEFNQGLEKEKTIKKTAKKSKTPSKKTIKKTPKKTIKKEIVDTNDTDEIDDIVTNDDIDDGM